MTSHKRNQEKDFSLNGELTGLIIEDADRLKGIKLAVNSLEYRIKLSKELRNNLPPNLTVGVWVEVVGCATRKKTGILKLKADSLTVLNTPSYAKPEISELQHLLPKSAASPCQGKVLICQKSACWKKRGGEALNAALKTTLQEQGLSDAVTIKYTGCMDRCKAGPNLVVMPDKTRYSQVRPQDIPQLVQQHFAPEVVPAAQRQPQMPLPQVSSRPATSVPFIPRPITARPVHQAVSSCEAVLTLGDRS